MRENFDKRKIHYIYGHYDELNRLRYIGKGTKRRAWSPLKRHAGWLEVFKLNYPRVEILEKNLDEKTAFLIERQLISFEKNFNPHLLNIHEGGYGGISGEEHWTFGIPRSQETRDRIKETKRLNPEKKARYWLGKKRDPELMKKLQILCKTPEAIEKARIKKKLWKPSEEHRKAVSQALKGKKRPEEIGKKVGDAQRGVPKLALRGKKLSEEHKAAISKATMGRRPLTAEEQARRMATWKARGMTSNRNKPIICEETGIIYRTALEAAKIFEGNHLNISKNIQACVAGKTKKCRGFTWKYV
jgi:hypothetical protein